MDFIKRNYEKIILSIVLLGLVGVAGFLPVLIGSDQQQVTSLVSSVIHPRVTALPDLDTSTQDTVLLRLKSATPLDFTKTNLLFNPVVWQKDKNGNLIKVVTGNEVGAGAAIIAKISPLYYQISLNSVITNESVPRYEVVVEDQATESPTQHRGRTYYMSVGETSGGLKLGDVKGPPDEPTELDLTLESTGNTAVVSPDSPFRQVDGYTAELKYAPESLTANNLRVGSQLNFAGDQYNVIAIDENDVILLAQSNQKKYVLPYSP